MSLLSPDIQATLRAHEIEASEVFKMSLKPPILTVGKYEFYAVSEHGMTFTNETPRAEWLDAVKRLTHFYEGSTMARERCLMCLADALNFGELAFGEDISGLSSLFHIERVNL